MSQYAPVVLFAYLRPAHLKLTLQKLSENNLASETDLFIYVDGLKTNHTPAEKEKHQEVLEAARSASGFKSVAVISRAQNFGLAENIINGVTETVNKYGKVIVVEDDLLTSKYFLKFMNEALNMYENEPKVISITGYMFPLKRKIREATFFIRGADCWGWATWKRGWDLFEPDGKILLKHIQDNNLSYEFDFQGSYPYTQMLINQIAGLNNSWAIRWYASSFINHKLSLYVNNTLVQNIGNDSSGTHGGNDNIFDVTLNDVEITLQPIAAEENTRAFRAIKKFFMEINGIPDSFFSKMMSFIRNLFSRR